MPDCKIVVYSNKGFWIAESFMQLAFHYIYEEVKEAQYSINNKSLFLEDMKFKLMAMLVLI